MPHFEIIFTPIWNKMLQKLPNFVITFCHTLKWFCPKLRKYWKILLVTRCRGRPTSKFFKSYFLFCWEISRAVEAIYDYTTYVLFNRHLFRKTEWLFISPICFHFDFSVTGVLLQLLNQLWKTSLVWAFSIFLFYIYCEFLMMSVMFFTALGKND